MSRKEELARKRASRAAKWERFGDQGRDRLAARLSTGAGEDPLAPVPLPRDGRPIPCSLTQRRLYFLELFETTRGVYNVPVVLRLKGALDPLRLDAAFAGLVERHESLRTIFRHDEDGQYQVIQPSMRVPLVVVALDDLPENARENALQNLLETDVHHPFDVQVGPLCLFKLYTLAPEEQVLLINVHHLLIDGWSMGLLIREVAAAYRGEHPAPPPLQYADFSQWWLSRMGEARALRELDWWKNKLSGAEICELRGDRPRPPVQSYAGASLELRLPEALPERISRFARQNAATPFMVLLAAFKLLVHRYTGLNDLSIGTPMAGRGLPVLEHVIGFFANTLVLRTEMTANLGFAAWTARVRETVLEAQQRQWVPFEEVVNAVVQERDLSRPPLFQLLFSLRSLGAGGIDFGGLDLSEIPLKTDTSKFDLSLHFVQKGAEWHGAFEYNTDLFDQATIAAIGTHFTALLDACLADPYRPIEKINYLSEQEYRVLTASPLATPSTDLMTPIARFLRRAEAKPERLALVAGAERLTYGALAAQSAQLAHYLRDRGLLPGQRVAVCLDRDASLVVAILAVLQAGGTYVPLDSSNPGERLALILDDADVVFLISTTAVAAELPAVANAAGLILLDREQTAVAAAAQTPLALPIPLEAPAYIIYTSGSTGRPKGVPVPHGNVDRLFRETDAWFRFNETDVWTLFHSAAFDFSVWEIWGPLTTGGTLVVVPYWVARNTAAFLDLLLAERVTVLNQTPLSFLEIVREVEERFSAGNPPEPALRFVIFGGEALDYSSLAPWFRRFPNSPRLINMYGITETTVHVTYREVQAEEAESAPGSFIGDPIPDLQLYVLDRHLQPVPVGVAGEIHVGGAGLAHGYLNRPSLSAERFIPHPFSAVPGARLYRTGDLARLTAGGELEYLGRIDNQVKINGFRIELGEIENVLARHPALAKTLVLAVPVKGRTKLIAWFTPQVANQVPDAAALRTHLQNYIPGYMIPGAFLPLGSFPLTPNGKIDRTALPMPGFDADPSEAEPAGPRNQAERILCAVWAEVLQVARVGIFSNYFNLGGDSLLSIRIKAKAEKQGLHFPIQALFQHPTVAGLAASLADHSGSAAFRSVGPFDLIDAATRAALPDNVEAAYPLAALQAGMLFHGHMEVDSVAYHDLITYDLALPWDPSAMRGALDEMAVQHPMFRTAFELTRFREPLQLVYQNAVIPLETHDWRDLADAEAVHQSLLEHLAQARFRWDQPPLLKVLAHRLTDGVFRITFHLHHAILDGWSEISMFVTFLARYRARLRGASLGVDPVPATYRDFVAAERDAVRDPAHRAFWRRLVAGAEYHPFPQRDESAGNDAGREGLVEISIDADLSNALIRAAEQRGMPLKTLLLAAHLYVTGLLLGTKNPVTGLVVNGRMETEGGDAVFGLFLNTVPFHVALANQSWRQITNAVFALEKEIMAYRRFPLSEIQRLVDGRLLFDTLFNFTHFHNLRETRERDQEQVVLARGGTAATNFSFGVDFGTRFDNGGVFGRVTYDVDRIDPTVAERAAHRYRRALVELATQLDCQPCAAEYLLPDEQTLVRRIGAGVRVIDGEVGVLDHFYDIAATAPDAVAVVGAHGQTTYAELDRISNRLAHELIAHGAGPERVVALVFDRSVEAVAAMLAVMKSGAAFLPLSSGHPAERLAYMCRDAGAVRVLASEHHAVRLSEMPCPVQVFDRIHEADCDSRCAPPAVVRHPRQLAYLIYTSGSSGRPKAVMISDAALASHRRAAVAAFGLTAADCVLQFCALGFDIAVEEIFPTLTVGATLVPVHHEHGFTLGELERLIERHQLTLLNLPTDFWHAWVLDLEARDATPPTSLRMVIVGGEQVGAKHHAMWRRRTGERIAFVNGYGPTETTITATALQQPAGDARTCFARVPIGRPLANTSAYVCDSDLAPVPPGTPGLLFLGGTALARGYAGGPQLTAARFVPDPFSDRPGARMYATGDRVQLTADGELVFLGRVDHQLKLRGYRIELGEIEAVLTARSEVAKAVVMPLRQEGRVTDLVAYLVPTGSDPDLDLLRTALAKALPAYMVPAHFLVLDALPLNPNGKVDTRALPAPRQRPKTRQAPRTDTECRLIDAWQTVLTRTDLCIDDDFFEVGGHSLAAIRLMGLVEAQMGRVLPIATLYRYPTLRGFARHLDRVNARPETLVSFGDEGLSSLSSLFLFHPVGGHVHWYRHLAASLQPRLAVFALQDPLTLGGGATPVDLTTRARDYLKLIRAEQPEGPYRLGGWSMGGVIAAEAARLLVTDGQAVEGLVLLDSRAPGFLPKVTDPRDILESFLVDFVGGPVACLSILDDADWAATAGTETLLRRIARENLLGRPVTEDALLRFFRAFSWNLRAADELDVLPPSAVPTLLVRAGSEHHPANQNYGWRTAPGTPLTVASIECDHYALMRADQAPRLAEWIRRFFENRRR